MLVARRQFWQGKGGAAGRKMTPRRAHELLIYATMQLAHKPLRPTVLPAFNAQFSQPKAAAPEGFRMLSYVLDEINAYVAIRDIALAEAEKSSTLVNLERVRIANEFVETCLAPAQSPYEAQRLPEADAARERGRCQAVKVRLALLRAHQDALSRDHAHAA